MTGSFAHCNLTSINMTAFVDDSGKIDYEGLKEAQEMAVYMAYIISEQEMDLYEWDLQNKKDKIIGVTINGLQDFFNKANLDKQGKIKIMQLMRKIATDENERLAIEYNSTPATAITTSQPSGTGSILMNNISAGVHWSHSPFYCRRIRISSNDPVSKALIENGFNWKPEVGQTIDNHSIKVFEFPVKAPKGVTKMDVSALEQLEMYKMMMENYVQHNTSITVHVRDDEWELVEQWLWDNWDIYVGISFISLDNSFYELLPYEAINEKEYETMKKNMPMFNVKTMKKYEKGEDFDTDDLSDCSGGACAIK